MPAPTSRSRLIALYLLAFLATFLIAPTTSVYWDAFGYLIQAATGQVGGLGLGRPVYVLTSHAIVRTWLGSGGSPWLIEPLLRICWMTVSCLAAPLTWRLAGQCGLSPRAAWYAGLAVAVSPAMAHTSGQVLTDAPAAAVALAAMVWSAKGLGRDEGTKGRGDEGTRGRRDEGTKGRRDEGTKRAAVAGALFGLAIGLREQAVLHAAVFALLLWGAPRDRRIQLALVTGASCAVVVLAPMAWVWWTQPGYVATISAWFDGLRADRAAHTLGLRDLAVYGGWLLALGPAVAVGAARAWTMRGSPVWRPPSVMFALAVPSLLQLLWVLSMRGVTYSPRFLLAAFPLAVALPGAWLLDRWAAASVTRARLVAVSLVVPVIIAAPAVRWQGAQTEATMREWPQRLLTLPANAVIVSGQPCPKVAWVQTIVAHDRLHVGTAPEWESVCPGWAWPSDLGARLDRAVADRRPVAIDLRVTSWIGDEQGAARLQAERYVNARRSTLTANQLIVWRDDTAAP